MFIKNKYEICRNVISKEVLNFLYEYILLKKTVCQTLTKNKYISPFDQTYGILGSDGQVIHENTYSSYGDVAVETLLEKLRPLVESKTKEKLNSNYTYLRVYGKDNELRKHIDRMTCEFSTTLNIGGDLWPIFLKNKKGKEIEVKLKPGDMLIYKGMELEHWRNKFTGNMCVQVFLHYNKQSTGIKYDYRAHLGLPVHTRNVKND